MLLFVSLSFGIYVARCEALTGCQLSVEVQLEESGEGVGWVGGGRGVWLYYITFNDIRIIFYFIFAVQYIFTEFAWKFVINMQ